MTRAANNLSQLSNNDDYMKSLSATLGAAGLTAELK